MEKPYVVHMDGKVGALKDEINESGFDVLESVSIPEIGGDLEITDAQKVFEKLVVLPNFPSNWATKESEVITQDIREFLASFDPRKPVMLQISEDIPMSEWQRVYPLIAQSVADFNNKKSGQTQGNN
jgi:hypothetical protein